MSTRVPTVLAVLAVLVLACGCNLFRSEQTSRNSVTRPNSGDVDMGNTAVDMRTSADMRTMGADTIVDEDVAVDDVRPPGDVDVGVLPDLAWEPNSGRVTDHLLLHYTFEEGAGTEVIDRGLRGGTPSLTLGPTATWLPDRNGVHIPGPERITSAAAGTEIWDWTVAREELSVEVWARPDNLTQSGPSRLVTFSQNSGVRNFTIGQSEGDWSVRFSVNDREFDSNGSPSLQAIGTVALAETQILLTYDGLHARLYINGNEVAADVRSGGLQHWNRLMPFLLGNENGESRPWAGEIYMLNVYDRALRPDEVQRNFAAGSNVAP